MNTLLLLAGGFLLLGGSKPSSSGTTTAPPMVPAQKPAGTGATDLAAAFGAFVGAAIASATKD